jgi:hypothetical protein
VKKYKSLIEKYGIKPKSFAYRGSAAIIETEENGYVIKKTSKKQNDIFDYLKTRNFNYYPKRLDEKHRDYEITEYLYDSTIPNEQKIIDLIELLALLHNKTTHYKEVTEDDYKEIYEDIKGNIEHLKSYYLDIIDIIESKILMSPSEYIVARNITKILAAIYYSENEIDTWYNLVKNKIKIRNVVLHNNLELDHFIRNENSYFINWEKSKIGIPVFDFYKLYKKHGLDYDFYELLSHYEKKYPLKEEERKLLFILMSLPEKFTDEKTEYQRCKMISKKIDFVFKSETVILPYNSEKREEY